MYSYKSISSPVSFNAFSYFRAFRVKRDSKPP